MKARRRKGSRGMVQGLVGLHPDSPRLSMREVLNSGEHGWCLRPEGSCCPNFERSHKESHAYPTPRPPPTMSEEQPGNPSALLLLLLAVGVTTLLFILPKFLESSRPAATPNAEARQDSPTTSAVDSATDAEASSQSYRTNCAACHQEDLSGATGTFPPLINDTDILHSEAGLTLVILNGLRGADFVCPSFAALSNDEISKLVWYVRSANGGDTSVSTEEIARLREIDFGDKLPSRSEVLEVAKATKQPK